MVFTQTLQENPKLLNPATLAFVGDAVYELMVRTRLAGNGSLPAGKLHTLAVLRVKAPAQAKAYELLFAQATPEEQAILKRGRNASGVRAPKSSQTIDYRKATALETLFGYLYLKGESRRLEELFTLALACIEAEEENHGQVEC